MIKSFFHFCCKVRAFLLFLSFLSLNSLAQHIDSGSNVSLINLIATPEHYDGKLVFIKGYVSIEHENMSICPSKDTVSTKDCIWINIDSGPYETESDRLRYENKNKIWKKFHKKVASIRGTFDKADSGHLGMWSGSITKILDVYGEKSHFNFKN